MPAKLAGATDVSEESTKEEQQPTLSKEIVDLMNSEDETETETAAIPQTRDDQSQEETEPSTTKEEETAEEEKETETEGEEKEEKPEPEAKVSKEWPDSAKIRVAEETAKRKQRTEERDKAIAEKTALQEKLEAAEAQLANATRPVATQRDPLFDVVDAKTLNERKQDYETLLEFCKTHRDGGIDIVIGKDKDGKEITQDFTAQEIAKMEINAEKMLRDGIPQREKFLAVRDQALAATGEIYPQFKEKDHPWVTEARQILAVVPELQRVPDFLLWIGHALKARDEFVAEQGAKKNGERKGKVSTNAEKILSAPKIKVAPGIPKGRTFSDESRNRSVDTIEQAKERMRKRGDDESMEDFVGAVLENSSARRRA
jgi:hypothetical protein